MSGASFTPDSILRVADRVDLELRSQQVYLRCSGGSRAFNPHVLAVLSAFIYPRAVREVLARLKQQVVSAQDWMSLTQIIHDLVQVEALVPVTGTPRLSSGGFGFDGATVHTGMLNDTQRTAAYLTAIRRLVKPGDVVVDLGTGTGILALAAAQAGAKRVYAIEASGIADLAQQMFEANGFAERITLLRGWSNQIDLPERADVLISELLGNDPFDEQILEAVHDAKKRFLKPEARMVPGALSLWFYLLTIPDAVLDEYFFTPPNIEHWSRSYGIDFSPLAAVEPTDTERFMVKSQQTAPWSLTDSPFHLASLDLDAYSSVQADLSVVVECPKAASINGVLLFSKLSLLDEISVSTDPQMAATTCWRPFAYRLPEPLEVAPGSRVRLRYRYRAGGKTLEVDVA